MVNFIRDHKNWCRTCTSFEKELRRYFHWEESEKVSTDVEHIHYTPFEKELRRYFHLRRLNIFQHFDLRRHWEGFLFEKDLRSMELLQSSWDGFEKVRWIWEGNVPSPFFLFSGKPTIGKITLIRNRFYVQARHDLINPIFFLKLNHIWSKQDFLDSGKHFL